MIVCHVSSAHSRYDVRIFSKMAKSLAYFGFNTSLVIADGMGNEFIEGVSILDAGLNEGGRFTRMSKVVFKVFRKALSVNADIYHLHDPELIFIGILLRIKGHKVIFDSHEDFPKQLKSKPYLNKFMRFMLSNFFTCIEFVFLRFYSGLIGATPKISEKLSFYNSNSITINNYPIFGELSNDYQSTRSKHVCYLGGISEIRGIHQMVSVLEFSDDTRLKLAGSFNSSALSSDVMKKKGWSKVDFLGQINRTEASILLSESVAGLVLFHAVPNHIESQPNKLFEYMSAGLPVICSNFKMWKDIVEVNNCGLCVNPLDVNEISVAIQYLINNPKEAFTMGNNGISAVKNQFNWNIEEKKLVSFYKSIL